MKSVLVLVAVLVAACGDDAGKLPDAAVHHDAPTVAPDAAGSGSGTAFALETHPHDTQLELLVAGLSVVVVVGPVRARRRRRDPV